MKTSKRKYKFDNISMGEAHHHTSKKMTAKTHRSKKKYSRKGKHRWGSNPTHPQGVKHEIILPGE
jgi:hypothetical protein